MQLLVSAQSELADAFLMAFTDLVVHIDVLIFAPCRQAAHADQVVGDATEGREDNSHFFTAFVLAQDVGDTPDAGGRGHRGTSEFEYDHNGIKLPLYGRTQPRVTVKPKSRTI